MYSRKAMKFSRHRQRSYFPYILLLFVSASENGGFGLAQSTKLDKTEDYDTVEFVNSENTKNSRQSLRGTTSTNSTADNYQQYETESFRKTEERQKVVLLGGPHKTGSTSIQNSIYTWIEEDKLPGWAWPVPDDFLIYCNHVRKAFYPLFQFLYEQGKESPRKKPQQNRPLWDFYDNYQQVIKSFQSEFFQEWKNGKHLVIGSESLDIINLNSSEPDIFIYDNLLKIMPWNVDPSGSVAGSDDDITFVVKYRAPRVDHLISIWHQCCMKKKGLLDFLKEYRMWDSNSLDSLGYVSVLLNRGIRVVLVDLYGVVTSGYDLSSVIACDVMNITCTADKRIVGDDSVIKIKNVRAGKGNIKGVTQEQLDEIEKKIRIFDCSYKSILSHPKLTILYESDVLKTIMEDCENIPQEHRIYSREHLGRVIRAIANGDVASDNDDVEEVNIE